MLLCDGVDGGRDGDARGVGREVGWDGMGWDALVRGGSMPVYGFRGKTRNRWGIGAQKSRLPRVIAGGE